MTKYNLDGGTGLFNVLGIGNHTKVIKLGSGVDIKHFKMFEYINAEVIEKNDDTIKVEAKDSVKETLFFPGDHLVINYSNTNELYVMDGSIDHVYNIDPLIINVRINKAEKLKDLRKHERFYVSLMANIRVCGSSKLVFAVVKNMSSGGIKINCNDQLTMEDVLEVEVILDRTNKLVFSGAVVRKNKLGDYYEYGVEIRGISETNLKCLYHYLKWLDSDYR
ncbi:PilZ domain-containing protein [Acetivibrio mesophilus]|uniref:PilZ domain-containing protein n=1 Tax=Acetivibrio mesophilus TaxID=2487273 RepID=A0A4Q0I6F2_9FIRM|nr:PilZ domain-containing protein [Acetivibrio mesophilus]ODM25096.1 pilus assembly protein PilZ [Clostridium sp. Bc-iso-3]RXE59900.1 PilZ domain-containing protein [Acetivibrio mesophilus]HHV29675.1 PilZ domain-containing protein [Clostridium sp.]